MSFTCSACGAKLWKKETKRGLGTKGLPGAYSLCCLKGRIALPEFTKSPPKLLMDLYTNKHPKSKHFFENVRQYNMVFAFTSMGGKVDESANRGRGPYTFRIRGQNCHRLGGLIPSSGSSPKYSQLYIYDTANEARNRTNAIGGKNGNQPTSAKNKLDDLLIQELMDLLDDCNPLVKITDGRNYNLPTVNEVAALIVGDIDYNFDKRDIVVDSQTDGLQRISELHPQYLALQYPLLFAYAEDGYRPDIDHRVIDGITSKKRKRVTMREFFAYKIQEREIPTLVHLACDVVNSMLGNRVKLPSSFTGCARYMLENYRDAMALCRVYGYPDLFITFTCNSKWPEISRALEGTGFNPEDKPAYQSRMLKIKLDPLMGDIKHNKIFGTVKADLYTVEFQKRGLPHAHICIFLDERDKLPDLEDIDEYIWAELPDKDEDPELYQLVSELMIHGPCDTRLWSPRKVFTGSIGRIHHVSPQTGELFFLRILLNKVKGPTCYEDIRTVNGIVCPTFKAACYEMGLLDDDQEYIEGIKEASTWGSGNWLRSFFAQLLLSESLSRPEDVFEKCFDYLAVDIILQTMSGIQPTREMIQNLILNDIQKTLQCNGKSLSNYSSMPIPTTSSLNLSENPFIIDELSYDTSALESKHIELIGKLNSDQKIAYETIKDAVNANNGGVFFLYGYGGTGKTFLWKTLSAAFRSVGEVVINVDSSGIAALLLSGSQTAHSRFAIPIDPTDESICRILPNSNLAALIRRANLIIWDEAPMVKRICFETMDRSFCDICHPTNPDSMDIPFGGKVIVFGGDFRQVLSVVTHGKREDIVNATLNSSYLWDYVTILKLRENMRLSKVPSGPSIEENEKELEDIRSFAQWLLDICDGNVNPTDGISDIQMPEDVLITDVNDPIGSIISFIYPDYLLNLGNPSYYQERAILAPTHEVVNIINDRMMDSLEGKASINIGGLPKHDLRLKVGVPVMLLRNIDQSGGLCNRTRLQVIQLCEKVIKAKVLTGTHVGKIVAISRMLIVPSDKRIPFRFQRRQFPIAVYFSMTINKSQGQSLAHFGLFLPKPVFSHGQLYVALSRVTSKKGLKVLILNKNNELTNTTKNVVFKEVLQHL
ncbi:uncharacterized protein [Rutidosis leptorrhynchoides]|uniref:uncharacterized protein n=1 Tax=Rutidosis leptorrhynchoides TaxID=125765 RepID=UPI003A99589C